MSLLNKQKLIILIISICGIFRLNAQITVDFTTANAAGCGSLSTSFCSTSTSTAGAITSYEWDICGVTSTLECPGAIITDMGGCTVCLTVTDTAGNTDMICKTDFVMINSLPIPQFSSNVTSGCVPATIEFVDESIPGSSPITEWTWGVGGSCGVVITTDPNELINCIYNTADVFGISLTVMDANGCTATTFIDDYLEIIDVPPLTFNADLTNGCNAPFDVQFTNTTNEPDFTYFWDFGNGQTFNGSNPPPVSYADPGQFSVTLSGTHSVHGCTVSETKTDFISIGSAVSFTASAYQACLGETITFEDTSVEPADSIKWLFGNGEESNNPIVDLTYATEGCYTVSLVRYVNGCAGYESYDCIDISNTFDVNYAISNQNGCQLPHTATFTNLTPGVNSYIWEIINEDGLVIANHTQPIATHEFTAYGTYNIKLFVTTAAGCSSFNTLEQVVIEPLTASIPETEIIGCVPFDFTISDDTQSGYPIVSRNWTVITNSGTLTSTDMSPTFTLQDTGCVNIELTVINSAGCLSTQLFENAVCAGDAPTIDFTANPVDACAEEDITFTATIDANVSNIMWDLDGDGVIDDYGNPIVYSYPDTGFFDVKLIVEHNGCLTELLKEDYMHIAPPVAAFVYGSQCEEAYTLEFANTSIGADSYVWTIKLPTGNEVFTTADISDYTFPGPGSYAVELEVFNALNGCSDIVEYSVNFQDLEANFTVSDLIGCNPHSIQISNESVGVDSFVWTSSIGTFTDSLAINPELNVSAGVFPDSEIKLVVYDQFQCVDSMILVEDIISNQVETYITISDTLGCVPFTVTFDDNSTNYFGTNDTWTWIIGDSLAVLSGEQVSYTFEEPGFYDVTLVVFGEYGCSGHRHIANAVQAIGVNASFDADSIICTSQDFTFANTTIGNNLTYLWDFGNGNTSSDETPSFNFDIEGTYDICLTVTDEINCTSTTCKEITVGNPIAGFSADNTYAFCPPLIVNFQNESSSGVYYEWIFGDNTGDSDLENPAHVYTSPGVYDVTLITFSSPQCSDTLVIEDFITIEGPVGSFDVTLNTTCNPVHVDFVGTSDFAYNYIWDFGNGDLDSTSQVNNSTISYTYTTPGNYIPKLILIDDAGCENVFSGDPIHVSEMTAQFTTNDSIVCGELAPVTLTSISESFDSITSYHWYIPGGTPAEAFTPEVEVTFASSGTYSVTLVTENEYCKDSITIVDYIQFGEIPSAAFTMSDSIVCYPDSILFTDQSTVSSGSIVSWEWDFGNGNTATTSSASQNFQPGSSHEVQLTVETAIGCLDSTTLSLDVLPAPAALVVDSYEICKNDQVELLAFVDSTQNLNYYWQPNPNLSCLNCLQPIANPTVTTNFTFVVDNGICDLEYPVTVTVLQDSIPVINIVANDTICLNEVTQLTATGGEGPFAYQWDTAQPGLSCYDDCSNPIASPTETTTYYLTITNASGCSATDSVTIVVENEFMDIATEDQLICRGDSTALNVSLGTNAFWHPSTGLSCVNCPNPIAFPTEDQLYIVSVETAGGCTIQDSVLITVVGPEDIDAGDSVTICLGEIGYLEGMGVGDIQWMPSFLLNDDNSLTPNVSPLENTTYYMHVDVGSCVLTDSVLVTVTTDTEISTTNQAICQGDQIELSVTGEADQYQWYPETGLSLSIIGNPIASPTETTTYQVIAADGSCSPDTAYIEVVVNELPEVYLPPVYYYYPGQTISLEIESEIADKSNFLWLNQDGLSCIICDDPYLVGGDSTANYSVVVKDPFNSCPDTLTTQLIPLNDCNENLIAVPNVFSPNGDDVNDIVYPYSNVIEKVELFQIYSRWGELLHSAENFSANDPGAGWDGTYKGKYMQPGVYVYQIVAICHNGEQMQKAGDITIFR